MQHVCSVLKVNFDERFMDKYASYKNITGDSYSEKQQATLTGELAGQRSSYEIRRPPRREGWDALVQGLEDNADYKHIMEVLKYPYR